MDKNNFIDVSALPMDTEKLQAIIVDLSRRLQNSAHTIEAQKRIAQAATTSAEAYRDRLGEVSRLLKLEISKNTAAQRKRLKEDEALNYETHKVGIFTAVIRMFSFLFFIYCVENNRQTS